MVYRKEIIFVRGGDGNFERELEVVLEKIGWSFGDKEVEDFEMCFEVFRFLNLDLWLRDFGNFYDEICVIF